MHKLPDSTKKGHTFTIQEIEEVHAKKPNLLEQFTKKWVQSGPEYCRLEHSNTIIPGNYKRTGYHENRSKEKAEEMVEGKHPTLGWYNY